MATRPEELVAIARRYAKRLREMEMRRAERMLEAWRAIERRLRAEAEIVAARLMAGHDLITPSLVLESDRYRVLLAQVQEELERFTAMATGAVSTDQLLAVQLGLETASRSLQVAGSFTVIPREAVSAFAEWTGAPTMPLVKLFREALGEAAAAMIDALMVAIGRRVGPARVATEMMEAFGIGLDRAMTISRTEVLRAYRRGTQDSYRASEVVIGYKRLATHDGRVCLGCLFTEGMTFDEERDFDAHPNCRCTLVPLLIEVPAPKWPAGEEWFLAQPDHVQRQLLGKTRYEMWKSGEVRDLRQFATHKHDPEWGGAFVPTPIRDLKVIAA